MSYEFPCPWCQSNSSVRGSSFATWRFKILCDACHREMVITFDGQLAVERTGRALSRSDDATIPFQTVLKKTG